VFRLVPNPYALPAAPITPLPSSRGPMLTSSQSRLQQQTQQQPSQQQRQTQQKSLVFHANKYHAMNAEPSPSVSLHSSTSNPMGSFSGPHFSYHSSSSHKDNIYQYYQGSASYGYSHGHNLRSKKPSGVPVRPQRSQPEVVQGLFARFRQFYFIHLFIHSFITYLFI
jgi:hypothetical protein